MRMSSSSLAFLVEASTAQSRGEQQEHQRENTTQLATPPLLPHVMPNSLLCILLGHVARGLLVTTRFTRRLTVGGDF